MKNPNKTADDKFQREGCELANYVCQYCQTDFSAGCYFNEKGVNQYVCMHHILTKKSRPDLRFEQSNGMCVCDPCHKEIHNGKTPEEIKNRKKCGKGFTLGFVDESNKIPRKKIEKFWGVTKPPVKLAKNSAKKDKSKKIKITKFFNKKTGKIESY